MKTCEWCGKENPRFQINIGSSFDPKYVKLCEACNAKRLNMTTEQLNAKIDKNIAKSNAPVKGHSEDAMNAHWRRRD
jgi:hypothetical protein